MLFRTDERINQCRQRQMRNQNPQRLVALAFAHCFRDNCSAAAQLLKSHTRNALFSHTHTQTAHKDLVYPQRKQRNRPAIVHLTLPLHINSTPPDTHTDTYTQAHLTTAQAAQLPSSHTFNSPHTHIHAHSRYTYTKTYLITSASSATDSTRKGRSTCCVLKACHTPGGP